MNEEFQPSKLKMALLNLKAKTFKRNKGAINFRYAKNFTIAYEVLENNAEQMALIDDFTGYLEQNGKTVIKIVIHPGKDTKTIPVPADRNRWNFCQADFNWYGFPKADGLQRVLNQPSDFFINLDMSFSYKTIAMSSMSNSVARVSLWQENYPAFFETVQFF